MADNKMKALMEIARLLVGVGAGWLIYWKWSELRTYDPPEYAFGAGIITAVMVIVLMKKLNKGSGD